MKTNVEKVVLLICFELRELVVGVLPLKFQLAAKKVIGNNICHCLFFHAWAMSAIRVATIMPVVVLPFPIWNANLRNENMNKTINFEISWQFEIRNALWMNLKSGQWCWQEAQRNHPKEAKEIDDRIELHQNTHMTCDLVWFLKPPLAIFFYKPVVL